MIFGPTGRVGSVVARTALSHGARITLAMRDPSKPIPDFPEAAAVANNSNITRVQADLTDPASVRAAVTASQAKHAFIYVTFSADLRPSVAALREGGVEFVVLLSSRNVRGDPRQAAAAASPAPDFITWRHAQAEAALDEVFGPGRYAAVRPGYFASNLLRYADVFSKGEKVVRIPYPGAGMDFVMPADIGRVCGNLLVKGGSEGGGKGAVVLRGPQVLSHREAFGIVAKAVGGEIEVEGFANDEDAVRFMGENMGMPEFGARPLVKVFRDAAEGKEVFTKSEFEEAVANIERYGGQKATTLQEWVEANRESFMA